MAFSSLLFLSVFLPAFLTAYWLSPRVLKNFVALGFSIVFYAWGAPRLMPVVLALGVIDYYLARGVAARREAARASKGAEAQRHEAIAKRIVTFAVILHISVLAYFKYSNFLVAQTNAILGLLPEPAHVFWKEVPLPIGISFLTFEEISYLVDVYRGDARPARSVSRYLLFLMLFPHSIAGPIFRWKDLERQLDERSHAMEVIVSGFGRFTLGLAKKVLVADAAAVAVDPIFAADPQTIGFKLAWIGALAYTIQIYFDFSGYSDMAIGLGKMAGFRFKENFDAPYISASITEFWKRWHISLSSWLRDYLYIPLGGNRHGERRTRLNVLIVFTLSGLWHGAAWNFVLWGAYHGLLSVLERTDFAKRARTALPTIANVGSTFALVVVGWVFFRAPNVRSAVWLIGAMVGARGADSVSDLLLGRVLPARSLAMLAVAAIALVLPKLVGPEREALLVTRLRPYLLVLVPPALVLSIAQLVNSGFSPLIYFKF